MKILLLGKNGQVGWELQRSLAPLGELIALDARSQNHCGDLTDLTGLAKTVREVAPDVIVNAAAYTAVDKAESEPELAQAVNAKALAVLAQAAKASDAWLVHYSTDYVFDGSKATPYLESDARNPLGIYGKSKTAGEEAIEDAFKHHPNTEAQFAILRTSWVYGDGGNFIRTILRLAKERESLKVIANQSGVPTSAHWLASTTLALVLDENHQLRSFPSGIYHAVPQGETTWHALACYAVQVAIDAGAALKLRPDQINAIPASEYPLPAPRPMNSRMARSALETLLNQILKGGDVTKLQQWQQPWQEPVAHYVQDLVLHKGI
jgi:dTDP-4-dehydrorhamnose reductase